MYKNLFINVLKGSIFGMKMKYLRKNAEDLQVSFTQNRTSAFPQAKAIYNRFKYPISSNTSNSPLNMLLKLSKFKLRHHAGECKQTSAFCKFFQALRKY